MRICDVLSPERILVDVDGERIRTKSDVLREVARLLAPSVGMATDRIAELLAEREKLQSTGIGDGVAVPHTALDGAGGQAIAVVLSPRGVPFDAIDGHDVHIVFGLVGPRKATGEHLRALARISRLLRDEATRQKLLDSGDASAAFDLIDSRDRGLR